MILSSIRVYSREALLLSDIMAGLDSFNLNDSSKKPSQCLPLPNKHSTEKSQVNQVLSKKTCTSSVNHSPTSNDYSFDPCYNIPLTTFSYHEVPFVDRDSLSNYEVGLTCSPPPSYPSSEYPFQKVQPLATQSGAQVLIEARKAMHGKFQPTQVSFINYTHELLKNRQGFQLIPTKRNSRTKCVIKDPHGICWPLKGERRNGQYPNSNFEIYLLPRLAGAREIRSYRDYMRLMALGATMIKVQKLCSPPRSCFSLPRQDVSFQSNMPSRLRHSYSLEDLVWDAFLMDTPVLPNHSVVTF